MYSHYYARKYFMLYFHLSKYPSVFYIIPKFSTNFDSVSIQSSAGSERRCLLPGRLRKDSLLMDTSCPRSRGLISGVSCRFATVQLPLSHNCSRSAELNVLTGPRGAIRVSLTDSSWYLQLFWPPYRLKYVCVDIAHLHIDTFGMFFCFFLNSIFSISFSWPIYAIHAFYAFKIPNSGIERCPFSSTLSHLVLKHLYFKATGMREKVTYSLLLSLSSQNWPSWGSTIACLWHILPTFHTASSVTCSWNMFSLNKMEIKRGKKSATWMLRRHMELTHLSNSLHFELESSVPGIQKVLNPLSYPLQAPCVEL